jgi:hypothetical protein
MSRISRCACHFVYQLQRSGSAVRREARSTRLIGAAGPSDTLIRQVIGEDQDVSVGATQSVKTLESLIPRLWTRSTRSARQRCIHFGDPEATALQRRLQRRACRQCTRQLSAAEPQPCELVDECLRIYGRRELRQVVVGEDERNDANRRARCQPAQR